MYTTDDNNLPTLHLPYVNPDQRTVGMRTMFLQHAVKPPEQDSVGGREEGEGEEGHMFEVVKSFQPRFVRKTVHDWRFMFIGMG